MFFDRRIRVEYTCRESNKQLDIKEAGERVMTPASVKLERPMPVARTATLTQGLTLSFADAIARHAAGARNAMD